MEQHTRKPAGRGAAPGSRAEVRHLDVGQDEAEQRIDNYLARVLKGVPRSRIYRILRRGEVRVNGSRVRPEYRLRPGDRVRIPPVRVSSSRPAAAAGGLCRRLAERIVFEDRRLLVIDKPAGVAVHGGSGVSLGVIEALRSLRPEAKTLELVHRLDRDTSGCLMIAKRRSTLRQLHAMLRSGVIEKRYLALVAGHWEHGARTVEAPLATARGRGGERVVSVSDTGKAAASRMRPLASYGVATLMEIQTLTGRTHQIRVHAAHAGHPVAGDRRYGDPQFNRELRESGLRRLFLHAHALAFEWPDCGEPFHVSAPLEPELQGVLDALERASAPARR